MNYAGISARAFLRERIPVWFWRAAGALGLSRTRLARALRRDALPPADAQLLATMRADNTAAPSPFVATEHWRRLNRQFDEWFHWEGIREVETQTMNEFFSSPSPTDPKLLRYATWMLYRRVEARDSFRLLDRVPSTIDETTGRAFRFEGRLVSWDLLISLDHLYSIYEVDPDVLESPNVFVELGAGWGRLAYALRMANPQTTYVVCDLPEVLLVSSRYLPRVLPRDRLNGYERARTIGAFDREFFLSEPGIWFLGTQHLDRIADASADFFVSVASFQEMDRPQVDAYFATVDRVLDGTFYTLQLRSSRTHALHLGEIGGVEEYPFRPSWRTHFVRNPSWSDLYFEATFGVGASGARE
jgi:putative sugar O-methyltransferase